MFLEIAFPVIHMESLIHFGERYNAYILVSLSKEIDD